MVNREYDENGGVTKTVTTTTTEEREYKVINYDHGSDLDEAIAADMAELDDLRQLAASAAVAKPKKVCLLFMSAVCSHLSGLFTFRVSVW